MDHVAPAQERTALGTAVVAIDMGNGHSGRRDGFLRLLDLPILHAASELVFYSGLGIPLLLAPPIGIHESYNLRWAREHGAGLKQRNPRVTGERIVELLNDGHLAACAWAGFRRAPHQGLYRIVERLIQ